MAKKPSHASGLLKLSFKFIGGGLYCVTYVVNDYLIGGYPMTISLFLNDDLSDWYVMTTSLMVMS
jgi:hypothetical protein